MALFQKNPVCSELESLKKSVLVNEDAKGLVAKIPEEKESVLVTYSLPKMSRSKKMMFNYELVGRNGKDGFLQRINGQRITPGCVIVPAENEEEIEIFLERHAVKFSKLRIMLLN